MSLLYLVKFQAPDAACRIVYQYHTHIRTVAYINRLWSEPATSTGEDCYNFGQLNNIADNTHSK